MNDLIHKAKLNEPIYHIELIIKELDKAIEEVKPDFHYPQSDYAKLYRHYNHLIVIREKLNMQVITLKTIESHL